MGRRRQLKESYKQLRERLHDLSIHRHHNAFAEAEFCDSEHGIFGSTPSDLLHAFLLGVLRYVCEVFGSQIQPRVKAAVDKLVDLIFGQIRSYEKHRFPRMNFKRGFTNLSNLTAKEWAGVALVFAILCNTIAGKDLLEHMFADNEEEIRKVSKDNPQFAQYVVPVNEDDEEISDPEEEKTNDDFTGTCTYKQFRSIIEDVLCFYAWYKRGIFSARGSVTETELFSRIAKMLGEITQRLPRREGNGWKTQKMHDMLHVPRDIVRFGEPSNYDTGAMERGLKMGAKNPSRTAQKRDIGKFNLQTASRLAERRCVSTAIRLAGLPTQRHSAIQYDSRETNDGELETVVEDSEDTAESTSGDNCIEDIQPTAPTDEKDFGKDHPRFEIKFNVDASQRGQQRTKPVGRWLGRCRQVGFVAPHPLVLNFFENWINQAQNHKYASETIKCYTEWSNKGIAFRAHPNYRSEGPWFDWCSVQWHSDSIQDQSVNEETRPPKRLRTIDGMVSIDPLNWPIQMGTILEPGKEFPARILGFFEHPEEGACAIIHSAAERNETLQDWNSSICEPWNLEYSRTTESVVIGFNRTVQKAIYIPTLRHVSVHSIVRRLLVVTESQETLSESMECGVPTSSRRILVIRDMEIYWPRHFTLETTPLAEANESDSETKSSR